MVKKNCYSKPKSTFYFIFSKEVTTNILNTLNNKEGNLAIFLFILHVHVIACVS